MVCSARQLVYYVDLVEQTFISALESSPVHCLNPRPSGNRRSPGNKGTAAILVKCNHDNFINAPNNVPVVDICKNLLRSCFSMDTLEILSNPFDEMIFKGAFDHLMEKIGR